MSNDPYTEDPADKDQQDQAFGKAAAEDIERADRGEAPAHEGDDVRAGGKAEPA